MLFGYFTLFVALVISTVAEFYSIVGLTSIFSAAFWPVVIMGGALGIGKVTAAVWLKLNWDRAKWTYKIYLVPAVVFLMFLTSMGIFGYLSKAHSDQTLVSGDVQSKISIYDEKIKIAKENIDANRKALKQLDEAVDQVMGRSTSETGADKAVAIRRSQANERKRLQAEIAQEQKTINKLSEESAPIRAEVRKVEAEVGPIKYIAAMIYGDNPDANLLEAAVRWVIILIVAVFDPLALMLILAAQQSLRWAKEEPLITKEDFKTDPEVAAFFKRGREVARALDNGEPIPGAVEVNLQDEQGDSSTEPSVKINDDPTVPPVEESILDKHPYLQQKFSHFENLKPMVYKPEVEAPYYVTDTVMPESLPEDAYNDERLVSIFDKLELKPGVPEPIANHPELQEAIKEALDNGTLTLEGQTKPKILAAGVDVVDRPGDYLAKPIEAAEPPPKQITITPEAFDPKKKPSVITADNDQSSNKEVKAHFGVAFPDNPEKGELYLRVDYLPSRLFKYNGSKWIEVDKSMTDSYVYNEEYIKFLIAEVDAARVDLDELSDSERDQITEYLKAHEQNRNAS